MSATTCTLPDGRTVSIADEAQERLCCGILVLDPVVVTETRAVWAATAELGRRLVAAHAGQLPSQIPGLDEARALYKSFGMDPSRHRPSSEALLRRVLKGKDLYHINNVVDTCNLASLTFLLPVGMYDLKRIQGDVILRTGRDGEQYPGIRKGPVNLAGRLGLFDQQGPFGSPTSDSDRTCTHDRTQAILAVIMATAAYSQTGMDDDVSTFSELFTEFCSAREVFRAVLGGA